MIARLIAFTIILTCGAVLGQKKCKTPNDEDAECVAIRACDVLLNAILKQDQAALDFAKKSQCGYTSAGPMVCCGTTAYPKAKPPPVNLANFPKEIPDRSVCGLEKEDRRIVGGEATDPDEFPWMAALQYVKKKDKENVGIKCGGTVINSRFVLTAAHCLLNVEFELDKVLLGEWDTTTDPDCRTLIAIKECTDPVEKYNIEESIPHPYYTQKNNNNDIGLIRVDRDIVYTDFIRPVCLPPENLPDPELQTLMTVAGWGITENKTESTLKLKVEVPLLSNDICIFQLGRTTITPNQLCAGGEQGKDSCRGDSGGPLMRKYEDGVSAKTQWYLEGVVGWGLGCGRTGNPAIYTRVARYVNWIINILKED